MGINSAVGSLGKVMGPLCAGYLYEANIEFPYIGGAVVSIVGLIVCIIWMRAGNRKAGRKDFELCHFILKVRRVYASTKISNGRPFGLFLASMGSTIISKVFYTNEDFEMDKIIKNLNNYVGFIKYRLGKR